MKIKSEQTVCEWKGVEPVKPEAGSKLGIAIDTIGKIPINGLRHKEENGTNGWYIWCGEEMSQAEGFFSPLHIEHITEYLPQVEGYLSAANYNRPISANTISPLFLLGLSF